MQSRIERLEGHVVVCGYGRMGRAIVAELAVENRAVVVVESDEAALAELRAENLLVVEGDATRDEVLLQAGVRRAGALIGVAGGDATNLMIVLSARSLNPRLLVVSRAENPEAVQKLRRAGADYVLHYHGTGAMHLALAVTNPVVEEVLNRLIPRRGGLDFGQLEIQPGAFLAGRTLAEIAAHECRALVLAIARGGEIIVPPVADRPLQAGDVLVVVGLPGALRTLQTLVDGQ